MRVCSFILLFPLWATSLSALGGEIVDPRMPSPMPFEVYRPQGAVGPLPAILMLHGHGGSERQWEKGGMASRTLERLIDEGTIGPHLLVMPGVGNSWYVSSKAYGFVDRVILDSLMPQVEAEFEVSSWSVVGLSMGGYGALRLGFLEPDRFELIAALSPAIFEPGAAFGEVQLKLFNQAFGEPFDLDVYEESNPFNLIPPALPAVYLSVGDDDYFHLEEGTFGMFMALKRAGHTPELRVRDGKHSWRLWRAEFEAVLREMIAKP